MPNVAVTLSVRVWIEMTIASSALFNTSRHPQCEGMD